MKTWLEKAKLEKTKTGKYRKRQKCSLKEGSKKQTKFDDYMKGNNKTTNNLKNRKVRIIAKSAVLKEEDGIHYTVFKKIRLWEILLWSLVIRAHQVCAGRGRSVCFMLLLNLSWAHI